MYAEKYYFYINLGFWLYIVKTLQKRNKTLFINWHFKLASLCSFVVMISLCLDKGSCQSFGVISPAQQWLMTMPLCVCRVWCVCALYIVYSQDASTWNVHAQVTSCGLTAIKIIVAIWHSDWLACSLDSCWCLYSPYISDYNV